MRGRLAAAAFGVPTAALLAFGTAEAEVRAETASPTVLLLQPTTANQITTEALVRVKGELEAAGFDVIVMPILAGDDAKSDLETSGKEHNPVAAFALFVTPADAGGSAAEIWVSDRVRQKTVIQRTTLTETDAARASVILAVRAVELLKVNLADFWAAPAAPPPPPPKPVPPVRDEPPPPPRRPFGAGLGASAGVGAVESFGAMAVTWAPDVTVSYGWADGWSVRASFLGLGPEATWNASQGSARADVQIATVDVVKTWWPRWPIVPFVTAGAGAVHDHIAGTGVDPYLGHTSDDWAFAAAAGAGAAVPLVSTVSLVVQARALAAWPPTSVQIATVEVGRVGAPSLELDAGLMGVVP